MTDSPVPLRIVYDPELVPDLIPVRLPGAIYTVSAGPPLFRYRRQMMLDALLSMAVNTPQNLILVTGIS